MQPQKPRSSPTTKLQLGVKGIVMGVVAFGIAGAIFAEGRLATSRVWAMMALIWSLWGLADIVSSRWQTAARILRIASFLCGVIGVWFAMQL
jgi:hypothetical protein